MKQIYKNLERSILALLITASIILIPSSVFGQYTLKNADVEVVNGVILSYKYSGSDQVPTNIIIPGTLDGQAVTSIGELAFAYKNLRSVTLPSSITSLGGNSFCNNYLESFIIPPKVESIGGYALGGNFLTDITIPSSVKTIGVFAFAYNSLTNVQIPNGVEIIGDLAFYENQLTKIEIPNSVKSLGLQAFSENRITSILIPESLILLGNAAFNANAITEINGKPSNGLIYGYNPDGTLDQSTIVGYGGASKDIDFIPASVTNIGDYAFAFAHLTSVVIPDGVTSIGKHTFKYNELTTVVIPDGVTSIEYNSFKSNKLNNVTIPNSVTRIGNGAFSDNQLTSIVIPNSITSIGEYAFSNNQLTSIVIPNSITGIGEYTFSNNQLTSIVIPNSVTSIGKSAFFRNQLTSLTIPIILTNLGFAAFNGNAIIEINGKPSNGLFYGYNPDGTLDTSNIVSYGGVSKDIDFIPNSVTRIGAMAFYYSFIKSINIPTSVVSIGDSAFMDTRLTSIIVPNGLISIGESAFYNSYLYNITIPNSVISIGRYAFSRNNLTSFILPTAIKEGYIFDYWKDQNDSIYHAGDEVNNLVQSYTAIFRVYLLGDANCDGLVNINDALLVARYAAGLITGDGNCIEQSCDVNKDGIINIVDAMLIAKVVAGVSPATVTKSSKEDSNQGSLEEFNTLLLSLGYEPMGHPTKESKVTNYPNPFNGETRIEYTLTKAAKINLEVFDITGKPVKQLICNECKEAGTQSVLFNGNDLPNGTYFYRLRVDGKDIYTNKMILRK